MLLQAVVNTTSMINEVDYENLLGLFPQTLKKSLQAPAFTLAFH